MRTKIVIKKEDLHIGMGGTIYMHSDRIPVTLIAFSSSRKTLVFREDKATRLDNNGMSEIQEYSYEQDPEGAIYSARLRKDGKYKLSGSKTIVHLGTRRRYYDYSF